MMHNCTICLNCITLDEHILQPHLHYLQLQSIMTSAAYKPYVDYILSGGVAETAYILSDQGVICATSLPINEMPRYEMEMEDEVGKKNKVIVDERVSLLEALGNKGVSKQPYGIRIYNQKYYPVNFDGEKGTLYLKKNKGGACVARTKKFILIGTFNEDIPDANNKNQNPGDLNSRVQALAKELISKGY